MKEYNLMADSIVLSPADLQNLVNGAVAAAMAALPATAAPIAKTAMVKVAKERAALKVTVETIAPREGSTFKFPPYRALVIENSATGRFAKRVVLDAFWLTAVRSFTGTL